MVINWSKEGLLTGPSLAKKNKNLFLRWSSKNVKNEKWIFSKTCLILFVSGREKNAHFRAHYLFLPKIFWDQNSDHQENYKHCGFSGNCPNPKTTPFLK